MRRSCAMSGVVVADAIIFDRIAEKNAATEEPWG
jgi:hypothetical protein